MAEGTQKTNQTSKLKRWSKLLHPAVPKHWLLIVAGVMWTGVGVLLASLAVGWLAKTFSVVSILLGLLGIGFSLLINHIQFARQKKKNIKRIIALNDKACVFSFQAWTGYLIIAIMMPTGIFLRNSIIPKPYLAVVYMAIGGALLQASLNYYRHFFQMIKENGS